MKSLFAKTDLLTQITEFVFYLKKSDFLCYHIFIVS